MLANNWIKLLDFHLVWHGSLVLVGGVVMACPGRRYQLDFFSHDLDLLSAGADFRYNFFDTLFIYNSHSLGGNTKFYKAPLALQPESMIVDIGQEPALGLVVRVGYVIS